MDITKSMKRAKDMAQESGLDFGDRKYLPVKDRLTIFREDFGITLGIDTNITIHGEYILGTAKVTENGNVLASGHAMFRIKDAAAETCETAAIGRALACLGLAGAEYASADEMERVKTPDRERQPENNRRQAADDMDKRVVRAHDPDDGLSETQADFKHEVEKAIPKIGQPEFYRPIEYNRDTLQRVYEEIDRVNHVDQLSAYFSYIEHDLEWSMDKEDAEEIKATFRSRRDQLKQRK